MECKNELLKRIKRLQQQSDSIDKQIDECRYQGIPYSSKFINDLIAQRDETDEQIIELEAYLNSM